MRQDIERIILEPERIAQRVMALGKEISEDYKNKAPLLICILRGAVIFYSDLCRAINIPVKMGFVSLSSYGENSESSGLIKIRQPLGWDPINEDIIIIEDIIDTGLTMNMYRQLLLEQGARSVKICTLLKKPSQKQEIALTYKGFDIENEFVVGYGLDFAERYRNLPYIGVLKKEIYAK
ncbi:MAG: hypoxanthine phosphoribosyltransferase [Candidatus Cloacimonetes bacterium]|nr:hypoxanthine phosphoribosyltransferase [Candidatus Cloacimonadota bacterium]